MNKKDYRFIYTDIKTENEYLVDFDIYCASANEDECFLEIDGDILLTDRHSGKIIDEKTLSKEDQKALFNEITAYLDEEQNENGYDYYLSNQITRSDALYDAWKHGD
jgi:hypothetical protein